MVCHYQQKPVNPPNHMCMQGEMIRFTVLTVVLHSFVSLSPSWSSYTLVCSSLSFSPTLSVPLSLFFPPSLLLIATMHFVTDTIAMLLSVVPSVDKMDNYRSSPDVSCGCIGNGTGVKTVVTKRGLQKIVIPLPVHGSLGKCPYKVLKQATCGLEGVCPCQESIKLLPSLLRQ